MFVYLAGKLENPYFAGFDLPGGYSKRTQTLLWFLRR